MRQGALAVALRLLTASTMAATWQLPAMAEEAVEIPIGERQLFLDEHLIARIARLRKTMHKPEKKGAVIRPDQPWEMSLQTRCAPAWDEQARVYKLWMITSTYLQDSSPPEPDPNFGGVTYAESPDGIHWMKPVLRQRECWSSLENNFLSFETNMMENALCDPDDPDRDRRFKGLLGALGRRPAVSANGIHWRKLGVAEIPSGDESNLSYDREGGIFIATLKTDGPYGRAHKLWISKDFETWSDTGVVLHADEQDQRLARLNIAARMADSTLQQPVHDDPQDYNADIYNVGICRYEGLYIGMPAVYHRTGRIRSGGDDGFHLIQLMCSRDLRNWTRVGERQAFIGPSPVDQRAYDLTQILGPSAPLVRGDELWFYYTGIKYRATPENPDPRWGAVCRAVLRRDGFVSLDADENPGTLLTKPFPLHGSRLFVNADAVSGHVKVEALDINGKPLAVSQSIDGDQPRAQVQWKSGELTGLEGKTVRLQFTLRKAKLYSFWLED